MPNGNYRTPLREAKHQRDLLKDYFNHVGSLAVQEDRTEADIYQSFSGQIIPRTFMLAGVAQISNTFPKKILSISSKFQNYFEPNHKSPKSV